MSKAHDLAHTHESPPDRVAPGARRALPVRGLRVGRASNVGRVRDHNEDTLLTFETTLLGAQAAEPLGWFVLADGMGGEQSGEKASALAARVVTHQLLNEILRSYLFNEPRSASQPPLSEALSDAVAAANRAVHDQVPGGGTTLTCALVLGERAFLAHVGDSRAYLFANNQLRQITQDHSLVDRLVALGQISPAQAMHHPQRNVLYRAVGQGDLVEVDTHVEPLSTPYRLLLCCDGLWGSVGDDQLAHVLRTAPTPQETCDRLVEAANAAGGTDNITVVVVEPQDYPG
jgi:protein phosphatase